MKTPVVLRVWKTGGGVLALFPTEPSDIHGHYCNSYESVGQHGGADYLLCIKWTRPATSKESAPLVREMKQLGHELRIVKRATATMHIQRRKSINTT